MPEKKEVEYVDLTKAEFEKQLSDLGEYSCSLPSGTTIGKKWFRNEDAYAFERPGSEQHIGATERKMTSAFPDWWQGEYVEHDPPHPTRVRIIWRKVRIVKEKTT